MFCENGIYRKDVIEAASIALPWEKLRDKTLLLTGATGLTGSFLMDVLLYRNEHHAMNLHILAVSRHPKDTSDSLVIPLAWDVNTPAPEMRWRPDFILHAASNAHPVQYANDPIGSLMTNLLGTRHLLDLARTSNTQRVIFLSSVEIYGQARNPQDIFDETYCGDIDCNAVRACYPEGKRAGEALCQAYRFLYGLDIVIPRLARIYGPTMKLDDSKAMSQFLKNGARGENIILNGEGKQRFSYCYVKDAVTGILTAWLLGKDGEAYNVADNPEDTRTLREITEIIAKRTGRTVEFDLPDKQEATGYSKVSVGILDNTKLRRIGWHPTESLKTGIYKTISVLEKRLDEEKAEPSAADPWEDMEQRTCNTILDFMHLLNRFAEYGASGDSYLFRGHARASYTLTPTLLRQPFLTQYHLMTNEELCSFETELLIYFFLACDKEGLDVPDFPSFRKLSMRRSFSLLNVRAKEESFLYEWLPEDVLEIAGLAQHYGLPTRILDWTRSFLTTTWFSLDGLREDDTSGCVIWAVDAVNLQEFRRWQLDKRERKGTAPIEKWEDDTLPLTFFVPPYHSNPNLCAQQGAFSLWKWNFAQEAKTYEPELYRALTDSEDRRAWKDAFDRIEDSFLKRPIDKRPQDLLLREYLEAHQEEVEEFRASNSSDRPLFFKITIAAGLVQELKKFLRAQHVDRSKIYPGYQGVADFVKETTRSAVLHRHAPVDVCLWLYGVPDKKYTSFDTTIASMLGQTECPVRFHVLHDATVPKGTLDALRGTAEGNGSTISFYPVDTSHLPTEHLDIRPSDISVRYAIEMMERLPRAVDRVFCLAAPLLFTSKMDVACIFDTPMAEDVLAGCVTPAAADFSPFVQNGTISKDTYVDASMLLWNRKRYRERRIDLRKEYQAFLSQGILPITFQFQDVINVVFAGSIKCISEAYHAQGPICLAKT